MPIHKSNDYKYTTVQYYLVENKQEKLKRIINDFYMV